MNFISIPLKKNFKSICLFIFISISFSGFSGCSRYIYRVAYNSIDLIIINIADNYFDFRNDQEKFFIKSIKHIHKWHRKTQLPLYAETLRIIKAKSEDGWNRDEVQWFFSTMDNHRNQLIKRVIPDESKLLATLNEDQINQLETSLAESNKKFIEMLNLTEEKRFREVYEKSLKNLKNIYGSISEEQEKEIIPLIRTLPDTTSEQLKYRQTIQKKLIIFMRTKPDKVQIHAWLNEWFLHKPYRISPEYNRKLNQWKNEFGSIMIKLDKIMTPAQKKHAVKIISGLIEELEYLASRS